MKSNAQEEVQVNKNTLRNKIFTFFKNIFFKEKEQKLLPQKVAIKKENSMFQEVNIKNNLAEKLRNDEVKISDLTDLEIEEMTEFFKKDIAEVDREIERIKMNILRMQEKLRNNTGI